MLLSQTQLAAPTAACFQYGDLRVKPLSACIGAEIEGLDLRRPLSSEQQRALAEMRLRYKVVFFRNQPLTSEQFIAFAGQFGQLERYPPTSPTRPGMQLHPAYPELLSLNYGPDIPARENFWHYDITPRCTPSVGSLLRSSIIPDVGGDTLFADMVTAYQALPDGMKAQLQGLMAVNDYLPARRIARAKGQPESSLTALFHAFPLAEAPLVRAHPISGAPLLWVNATFTVSINGMDDDQSQTILRYLTTHYTLPEFQCRFRWSPHTIAFWDNVACQHYAANDYWPQVRSMDRVSLINDIASPEPS